MRPDSICISTIRPNAGAIEKAEHRTSVSGDKEKSKNYRLESACQEMESLFLHYLLQNMRETVPESGLLDQGSSSRIYKDMLDSELAEDLAHKGGIGLSRALFEQFQRIKLEG